VNEYYVNFLVKGMDGYFNVTLVSWRFCLTGFVILA